MILLHTVQVILMSLSTCWPMFSIVTEGLEPYSAVLNAATRSVPQNSGISSTTVTVIM